MFVIEPGTDFYRHPDWLGGSRFSSTYFNRTMHNDLAYAPYGEQYATAGGTGVGNVIFAGNNEDTTTNLYDAQFREYEIYGRWPSPDPAGLKAADPRNPQSWNRYAYVLNNPLKAVDPTGLFCVWDDGSYDGVDDPGDDPNWTYDPDACSGAGGTWFDGSPSDYGLSADWSSTPASQPDGTSLASIALADQLQGGGWVTANTIGTILQNAAPYLALQEAGQQAQSELQSALLNMAAGDTAYLGGWYAPDIADFAVSSWDTLANSWNALGYTVGEWQAGDLEGFMNTMDMGSQLLSPGPPTTMSPGALFGWGLGTLGCIITSWSTHGCTP